MKQRLTLTLLLLLTTITFAYSQAPEDANKATVIFYRSSMWGSAYHYKIKQDDSTLTKIKYKAFYVIKLNEGTYKYWAENGGGKYAIALNVRAGNTYVVKCGTSFSFPIDKPKMTLLTVEEAKKEAKKSYFRKKLAENKIKI